MSNKHGVPAILSFLFPGLGQLIKGQIFKAIGIWLAMAISTAMIYVAVGLLTTPIIYLWQIYDAYNN